MQTVPDIFQERYLKHQERKTNCISRKSDNLLPNFYYATDEPVLFKIMENRKSRRFFKRRAISNEHKKKIFEAASFAPSSCNRKAVIVEETDLIDFVGGAKWFEYAPLKLAFIADMEAYKSPIERPYMPYLDTGFIAQNIYLACEVLGLGCCYVNPNRREKTFEAVNNKLITGAMAIGYI